MMLFKGYVRTCRKKSRDKFKAVELRTYDEVKNQRSYAGVLAENTVLIDVDTETEAELLFKIVESEELRCQVRETTHGMHFFFKNNGAKCFNSCSTKVKSACGITVDVKTGKANSYSVLKNNNVEREIIYDILEGEEYQEVPCWLNILNVKELDVLDKVSGDGRNSFMFSHILRLQQIGLTKDEIKETLRIINTYIFKEPLSDKELETITRDEAFVEAVTPSFFEGKNFLFNVFAKYLVDNLPIKRINGVLHVFQDGYYSDGNARIEKAMIELIPSLSKAKRTETLEYIKLLCVKDHRPASANYIGFKNGIYDLDTDLLIPFSPDILLTNKIPHNYNVNAESEILNNTLNKLACGDESIRTSLEEIAGYCMYRRNEMRKSFILIGDKANGKSTYLAVLQKMLGEDNISALDMKELSERFKPAEMYCKLANIGDDISDDFIPDTAIFKKLVTGDKITVERKGQDPFTFNNYSKLIFSANNLPRVKDKTGAVLDRLVIVPFNATFSKTDPDYDPYIKYKLLSDECIEYLIKLGVEALKNILSRKSLTMGQQIIEQLNQYDELNNPILTFFEEWDEDRLRREPIDMIYASYKEHCLVNNFTPISRIEFSRQTKKIYEVNIIKRYIQGKYVKFFQ